jgi:hypothetical protein
LPSDCSSGGTDGYCDNIKDGVCDQDCTWADSDCERKYLEELKPKRVSNRNIVISIITLIMISLVVYLSKRNLQNAKKPQKLTEIIKNERIKGRSDEKIKFVLSDKHSITLINQAFKDLDSKLK